MAYSEIYVDPSINANTGTGAVADPYGDLQFALDSSSHDTTNGTRFNIKAGVEELLSSQLSFTGYGTTTYTRTAPLVFQGYTATAGDGGFGVVNLGGNRFISNSSADFIAMVNMEMHNASNRVFSLDNDILVYDCYFHDVWGPDADVRANYIDCRMELTGGGPVINNATNLFMSNCYVKYTGSSSNPIVTAQSGTIVNCIFDLTEAAVKNNTGISFTAATQQNRVLGNTLLHIAGTGTGIDIVGTGVVQGNIIEGFSGAGGIGVLSTGFATISKNAAHNNTTNYSLADDSLGVSDNENLVSSPLAKTGANTYGNLLNYFAPQDVGNVIGGLAYNKDKGAVQSSGGGGGTTINPSYYVGAL